MSKANVERVQANDRSQNYQRTDASMKLPEVLRPYMGGIKNMVG